LQHYEPKLTADELEPVEYPPNPHLEWCPPGHGDFYAAFYDSGVLKQCISEGYKYAFVSNSDNLGAVWDPTIAQYFAGTNATILLELADKTKDDIKGGHVVLQNGNMLLREVAQIAPEDKETALDPSRHPYFNTNSIWLNLELLWQYLNEHHGVVELPLIRNEKTVDPADKSTQKVIQMESAIGAGISAFTKTAVINVPRSRFLPVKTNEDLARLRSDAYIIDDDWNFRAA
jgi:UTP--glucose-1-phosphate uridylyltransferase